MTAELARRGPARTDHTERQSPRTTPPLRPHPVHLHEQPSSTTTASSHDRSMPNTPRAFTITDNLVARFAAKVDRAAGDDDACWPWTASTRATGYGQINEGGNHGRPIKAHRLAFAIAHGWWPDVVCHSCDNPRCCNPRHLFAADQQTNLADMRAKGRQARGEQLGEAISAGKQRARALRRGEVA